jgi:hypothetical protein
MELSTRCGNAKQRSRYSARQRFAAVGFFLHATKIQPIYDIAAICHANAWSNANGESTMAKYGKKASNKVERAMRERKQGKLKSGRSGKKVTSRKQAIAIGLSEARREGAKVPRKKSSSSKK